MFDWAPTLLAIILVRVGFGRSSQLVGRCLALSSCIATRCHSPSFTTSSRLGEPRAAIVAGYDNERDEGVRSQKKMYAREFKFLIRDCDQGLTTLNVEPQ